MIRMGRLGGGARKMTAVSTIVIAVAVVVAESFVLWRSGWVRLL
jgi:hypothetical protein